MNGQPGFFDIDEGYAKLSEAGDPLERLVKAVDFEVFRHQLRAALNRSDRGKGGRPPYDPVLMFKVLVLQALYNLSDDQTEFQIRDRLSFMRFLGLGFSDPVPGAKTIWLFRELLVRAAAMEKLFGRFEDTLRDKGYFAMGGQIVDATIVEAPHQRNTDAEKADLKAGKVPDEWKDKPAKLAQKDRDARWTLKRGRKAMVRPDGAKVEELVIPAFGYKNHVESDQRFGFVRRYLVTSAAAHDSRPFPELLDKNNIASPVWADTAYRSARNERFMERSTASSRRSISESPRADRCRSIIARPMSRVPACARPSSTSSPPRSIASGCSCAPSAWPAPTSRSAWSIWSTTSPASPGWRENPHRHRPKPGSKGYQHRNPGGSYPPASG